MQIRDFISRLQNLQSTQAFADIKWAVCEGGLREIQKTFATETDPYGNIWPPTKEHEGHKRTLVDRGDLKASFRAWPTSKGVMFVSDLVYAASQQYGRTVGSGRIMSRKMLPVASQGIGQAWMAMITRAISDRFRRGVTT